MRQPSFRTRFANTVAQPLASIRKSGASGRDDATDFEVGAWTKPRCLGYKVMTTTGSITHLATSP
jgi:hypothetical protein